MKVLCNCWRKSDTCVACYMASVDAMSAQRRLEEDLRLLELINVYHLVNLPSNNPSAGLYLYPERLESLTMAPQQGSGYSQHSSYQNNPPSNYQYMSVPLTSVTMRHHVGGTQSYNQSKVLSSSGFGTSLPYPDLLPYHPKSEVINPSVGPILSVNGTQYIGDEVIKKDSIANDYKDFSPVIQNSTLSLQDNPRLKHLSLLPKEPHDYDAEDSITAERISPEEDEGRKTVKFAADTVFVERDMNSPFWKAFTERRRLRRINRQRKQLNAQIAHASYQPSIVEIVKTAFGKSNTSKDNNGNHCVKKKSPKTGGEVLVYENSSQIPEKFTAHYVYTSQPQPAVQQKRSSKFLQMLTCQCCSSSSSQS